MRKRGQTYGVFELEDIFWGKPWHVRQSKESRKGKKFRARSAFFILLSTGSDLFFSNFFFLLCRERFGSSERFILRKSDLCTPKSSLPEGFSTSDPGELPSSVASPRSDKATPPSRLFLSRKQSRISSNKYEKYRNYD